MKLFTSPDGKFQLFIPKHWQYKNVLFKRDSSEPHAFGEYEDTIGAFQVSCRALNEHIAELIIKNKLPVQKSKNTKIHFSEKFVEVTGTCMFSWMAAIEDHFVFATFTYQKKETERVSKKVNAVRKSLDSFKFIRTEFRNKVLADRRYSLFMYSLAATIDLRNKALENGSFIELIVLTANRIDALLRLSLLLTRQLKESNDLIDISLLYQGEEDKPIMERQVYTLALKEKVITQTIFDDLERLYKDRNRVVHRYIITDIQTEDIITIVFAYYDMEEKIDVIINDLERQQFEKKIGLNAHTEPGVLTIEQREKLEFAVKDKHGNIKWGKA